MKIISGSSNLNLSNKISEYLNIKITQCKISRFLDSEIRIEIADEIKNQDIFIIQSTCNPVNDNLVELLLLIDATKRAGAKKIIIVVPYFGYARQDRRADANMPISASLVAKMIYAAGADRLITIELHSGQIEGFFDIPIENLSVIDLFIEDIKNRFGDIKNNDLAIVAPDAGRINLNRKIADFLQAEMIVTNKIRNNINKVELINIFGNYQGKNCIIIDDIVDSAGTLCKTAEYLFKNGAKSVSAYVTHPVLSGNGLEKIKNSCIKHLIVTDSIFCHNTEKISVISVAKILADSIMCYAG